MGGKRKNNFSRALAEAKQRLKGALRERVRYETKLGGLRAEIPALQATIQALEIQINPNKVGIATGFQNMPNKIYRVEPNGGLTDLGGNVDIGQKGPVDIAKLAGPQSLEGVGSVPFDPKNVSIDDEILPDAEGTEMVPE